MATTVLPLGRYHKGLLFFAFFFFFVFPKATQKWWSPALPGEEP